MHVTVESYHHTMQGGAVVSCITDVLRSADIHNLLRNGDESYYM